MTEDRIFDLPDLPDYDFTEHNAESKALWAAFQENTHARVPVRLNTNPRMLMLDPAHNKRGLSYCDYMLNPDLMAQGILEWFYWMRHFLPGDHEKGLPEEWTIHIDFENTYDPAWFGAPVEFHEDQVPYAAPLLNDDNKRMLFDKGLPDPFAGEWVERARQHIEHWKKKIASGWTFLGRPVTFKDNVPYLYSDGAFTCAASLRGPTGICTDLLIDPDFAHELLRFINDAFIARIRAWRKYFGQPEKIDNQGMADDSVEMLSVDQYREFVLPRHRDCLDALGTDKGRGIHLCGNAQRLFPTLKRELGIMSFDTGFPVDFARFRQEMGPDVLISGGPRAPLFVEETPDALLAETRRILEAGVLEGGRFILQEGNNLPPCASLEHCWMFYKLGRELGRLG